MWSIYLKKNSSVLTPFSPFFCQNIFFEGYLKKIEMKHSKIGGNTIFFSHFRVICVMKLVSSPFLPKKGGVGRLIFKKEKKKRKHVNC